MNFHERPDEAIIVMNVYLPAGSRTYLGVFVFGVFLSLLCVIWLMCSAFSTSDAWCHAVLSMIIYIARVGFVCYIYGKHADILLVRILYVFHSSVIIKLNADSLFFSLLQPLRKRPDCRVPKPLPCAICRAHGKRRLCRVSKVQRTAKSWAHGTR